MAGGLGRLGHGRGSGAGRREVAPSRPGHLMCPPEAPLLSPTSHHPKVDADQKPGPPGGPRSPGLCVSRFPQERLCIGSF